MDAAYIGQFHRDPIILLLLYSNILKREFLMSTVVGVVNAGVAGQSDVDCFVSVGRDGSNQMPLFSAVHCSGCKTCVSLCIV